MGMRNRLTGLVATLALAGGLGLVAAIPAHAVPAGADGPRQRGAGHPSGADGCTWPLCTPPRTPPAGV